MTTLDTFIDSLLRTQTEIESVSYITGDGLSPTEKKVLLDLWMCNGTVSDYREADFSKHPGLVNLMANLMATNE